MLVWIGGLEMKRTIDMSSVSWGTAICPHCCEEN